jgi:hypothetical protein
VVRRGGLPDFGEVVSLFFLAVIGAWGVWFAVQSMLTLWWPLNALYLAAGVVVFLIAAAVGRAILIR